MKARTLSFLIALVLLLQIVAFDVPVSAADASVARLEVSTENVFAGEAIYVTVSLTSNPGLTYVKLKVSYDTNVLTLFGVQNGEIIDDLTRGNAYVWSAIDTTTATGTFATLIFSVSETAAAGTYPVTITCIEASNHDNDVSMSIQNGSVTVNAEECMHDMESVAYEAPTCKAEGYRILECTKCDHAETVTFDVVECEEEEEAGCTTDAKCKYCGRVLQSALGHKYRTQVIAPTTTSEGYTLYTCMRCGNSYKADYLPPIQEHDHTYAVYQTVDATCKKDGYTLYKCSDTSCGDTYQADIVKALGHSYTTTTVAPTCQEMGYMQHTCSCCGEAYKSDYTATIDHEYVNGKCVYCGETTDLDTIPVTGITLSDSAVRLKQLDENGEGTGHWLSATITPNDATNQKIIWTSSDNTVADIAFVDEHSLRVMIIPLSEGTATVTATTADGEFSATCIVTVWKEPEGTTPATGITLSDTEVTMKSFDSGGVPYQLQATVLPSDTAGQSVRWTSSDPSIVDVMWKDSPTDNCVRLFPAASGTATITATTMDGKFSATCVVTVLLDGCDISVKDSGYKWYASALRAKLLISACNIGGKSAQSYRITVRNGSPEGEVVFEKTYGELAAGAKIEESIMLDRSMTHNLVYYISAECSEDCDESNNYAVVLIEPPVSSTDMNPLHDYDENEYSVTDAGHVFLCQHNECNESVVLPHWYETSSANQCVICGYIRETPTVHQHSYTQNVTAPDCSNQGYTTYICSCGDSYVDTYVEAMGHAFAEGVCARCGSEDPSYTVDPNAPKIVINSATILAGETVTVEVKLENNPGVAYLLMTLDYDKSVLTLVSVENGELLSDMDKGVNLAWSANQDCTTDGLLCKLTFRVSKNAAAGRYTVKALFREAYNYDDEAVTFSTVDGTVEVIDFVYGDANGDGVVNGRDVLLLRKYMANYDFDTGTSSVEVGVGADANGDGVVNGRDVLLLRKYMANYDFDTGTSSVVLGPKE